MDEKIAETITIQDPQNCSIDEPRITLSAGTDGDLTEEVEGNCPVWRAYCARVRPTCVTFPESDTKGMKSKNTPLFFRNGHGGR